MQKLSFLLDFISMCTIKSKCSRTCLVCRKLIRPKFDLLDCLLQPCKAPINYYFLISRLHRFAEIEFITVAFTDDVGTDQVSVVMNVTPTNVSLYCTASKNTLLYITVLILQTSCLLRSSVGNICRLWINR